jgi:hypothetical protein
MKKIIITFVCAILVVAGSVAFYACSSELDMDTRVIPTELQGYFNSQDYVDLKGGFGFKISDFSFDNVVVQEPILGVSVYQIPIRGKNICGILTVLSKNDGEIHRSLFEDRTEFEQYNSGTISIYTAKRYFVADYWFEKLDETRVKMHINSIGNSVSLDTRLKTRSEAPFDKGDGWWKCTTNCYSFTSSACSGDAGCKILCDLLNIGGVCTITVSMACAISCM